jgi:CheY-like chemotaxis protein
MFPLHILVVEDHRDSALALTHLLRFYGHRAQIADSCRRAKQMFAAERYDLVLCDLGLPDGDGCDLLHELRAIAPVKALAITGFGMTDDLARTRDAGFLAHITKPVVADRLRTILSELALEIARESITHEAKLRAADAVTITAERVA